MSRDSAELVAQADSLRPIVSPPFTVLASLQVTIRLTIGRRLSADYQPAPLAHAVSTSILKCPLTAGVQSHHSTARALDSGQRVAPLQAMEPGKVGIGGTEFRSVLDGQGSKMCVGSKISASAQRQE